MVPTEGVASALGAALAGGVRLVYLRERPGTSAPAIAVAALEIAGSSAITIDLDHLNPSEDPAAVARTVGREALLTSGGVVAGPIEALLDHAPGSVRAFAGLPGPVLLHGRAAWEPSWSRVVPLVLDTLSGSTAERRRHWEMSLGPDAPAGLGRG